MNDNILVKEHKREIKNSFTGFFIELTNVCNFNCRYCTNDKMTREKGFMPLATAKRIIDEISEKKISSWICLHLMGEPTLHPNLFEIIKYSNEKNLDVSLITNGTFDAEELAAGLKNERLASLQLSINAFTVTQYNLRNPKNLSYDEYIENIKKFIKIYLSFKKSTPILLTYLFTKDVCMPRDSYVVVNELDALNILNFWVDFWNELNLYGQNEVRLDKTPHFISNVARLNDLIILDKSNLKKYLDLSDLEPTYRIAPSLFIYFKRGLNWHNQLIDDNLVVRKRIKGRCMVIEREFAILWNGDCTFCCGDFDGKMKLGNIYQNSIEEILLGGKVAAIRRDNKRSILNQEICQICRGSLYDKEMNREISQTKFNILTAIKTAKAYYCKYGLREFLKKVLSLI